MKLDAIKALRSLGGLAVDMTTTARGAVAGVMLVMAGGRLGLWTSRSIANALSDDAYASLLAFFGLALIATAPWRGKPGGRLIAALSAALLAGMAWDVGVFGTTALIEFWMAVCLAVCALSHTEC